MFSSVQHLTPEQRTAATAAFHRRLGIATKPRAVIPRAHPPIHIETEYAKQIVGLLDIRTVFQPLMDELPKLLAMAAAARGDAIRLDASNPETRRTRELMQQAIANIQASTSQNRIEAVAQRIAVGISENQRRDLQRQATAAIGINLPIIDKRVPALINHFTHENVALIQNLGGRAAGDVEKLIARAFTTGQRHDELAAAIQARMGVTERHAGLIARDQIGSLNGQVSASRHRELGIRKFTWTTMGDDNVRPEHEILDEQEFSYDDPPSEGLPGEPICCRCMGQPVFSDIQSILDGDTGEDGPSTSTTTSGDGTGSEDDSVDTSPDQFEKIPEGHVGIGTLEGSLGIPKERMVRILAKLNVEKPAHGWSFKPDDLAGIESKISAFLDAKPAHLKTHQTKSAAKIAAKLGSPPVIQAPPPPHVTAPKTPEIVKLPSPKTEEVVKLPPPKVERKQPEVARGSTDVLAKAMKDNGIADVKQTEKLGQVPTFGKFGGREGDHEMLGWNSKAQEKLRLMHDDVLSRYGLYNQDAGRQFRRNDQIVVKTDAQMGNANATHSFDGLVTVRESVAKNYQAALDEVASGKNLGAEYAELKARTEADPWNNEGKNNAATARMQEIQDRASAYRTMTHEQTHGHGPSYDYQGMGVFVEEVVTESAARRMVNETLGFKRGSTPFIEGGAGGSYGGWISGATNAIRTELKASLGIRMDRGEAGALLGDAALRYKTYEKNPFATSNLAKPTESLRLLVESVNVRDIAKSAGKELTDAQLSTIHANLTSAMATAARERK